MFRPPNPPETPPRYDLVAVVLHWSIAIALFFQVAIGWLMQEVPKQPPGPRAAWFNLHKSIGLTLGALVLVRLAWRLAHRPPPFPERVPIWQARGAVVLHRLLYVAMLALPLSGLVGSIYSGRPIRYFAFALPTVAAQDDGIKSLCSAIHEAAGWLLLALVLAHAAAGIAHLVVHDGVFARMWPWTSKTPPA
ncbi:MAG TPA: cytochrome b [Burkholderiaceae bacterium]|nr:cytochrome b [Burkholderiaceae bacterium]